MAETQFENIFFSLIASYERERERESIEMFQGYKFTVEKSVRIS